MSANWWEDVANAFITHYYTQFDSGAEARTGLATHYQAESMLTFQGEPFQGPEQVQEKLKPSSIVSQPAPNGGVLVMVSGMLQTDEDPALPFSQIFQLLPAGDSYYVYNDIFNLILFG